MPDLKEDAALSAALALFWSRGPETAAYGEIVQATGLSRKALYARWPDKQHLVAETLALYRNCVLAGMLATLRDQGPGAFWDRLALGVQAEGWRGCYLMRTGSGPLRGEPAVAAAMAEYLDALQSGFKAALADRALPVPATLAATQCVALLTLISHRGAAGDDVAPLIEAGRQTCGV